MIDPFSVDTDVKFGVASAADVLHCAAALGDDWREKVEKWRKVYKTCPVVVMAIMYPYLSRESVKD